MRLVLFMPWAMIGAFGWLARNSFHRRVLAGKLRVQHDAERNIQLFEQAADPRDPPVDRVLTKCLVHEVGTAGREVRTQHWALAEAELFDEQGKADADLSAGGPRSNMDRDARQRGHPVGALLRQNRGGMVKTDQRRCRPAEQGYARTPLHCPSKALDIEILSLAHPGHG